MFVANDFNYTDTSAIAIIGFSFRFPNDHNNECTFWQALKDGENLIGQIPSERWATDELQHSKRSESGRSITFSAGVLSKIDEFDANFFGISPREAAWIDPQQRLLLELSWEAMENAHIKPSSIAGSDCAVYVGISGLDYGTRGQDDLSSLTSHIMTGNTLSIAANRLSYVFDLHGPSLSIDTACSSSLVALHHACKTLQSGEASTALVGGVNMLLHPYPFVGFTKASMLSADGLCKTFDASGNGYVRAEGGAILLIKPLDKAIADGDDIQAVILASGVNTDGSRKTGITIPSREGQIELMQNVLSKTNLTANDIDFVEAHGTGTSIGDPIETAAIGEVYGKNRSKPLPIGSVKANLGHMEPASGMSGIVKTILSLKNRALAPQIHLSTPNPHIDFSGLNIQPVTEYTPLTTENNKPLIAGVNSFGFGGANAHILLQEYRTNEQAGQALELKTLPPLLLSARSIVALQATAANYQDILKNKTRQEYYNIAYETVYRRERMEKHLTLLAKTPQEALEKLEVYVKKGMCEDIILEEALSKDGSIAFVYSGNGAQWIGMGHRLMKESKRFSEILHELNAKMQPVSGFFILDELYAESEDSHMDDTVIAQPLLFAIQVGLTQLLQESGIVPYAVAGHSVGEVAAAWACGALSLENAIRVIVARSQAQGTTRGTGRMAAVGLSTKAMQEILQDFDKKLASISIAGINSPNNITISGSLFDLQYLQSYLEAKGTFFRLLDLDYAFHSSHMDPIEPLLSTSLEGLNPSPTNDITFVSTVTGECLKGEALDADYWWRNVREPVRFADAISSLSNLGCNIFIEISPHAILQRYIGECLSTANVTSRVLPTLRKNNDNLASVTETTMRIHMLSSHTNLKCFFPIVGSHVQLPNYPWQRERHWHPKTSESLRSLERRRVHPLLGWPIPEAELSWENVIDPIIVDWLGDHKIGGAIVFPGAAYAEMALAAAKEWLGGDYLGIEDLDIVSPMVFDGEHARTLRLEINPRDGGFHIKSRQRLSLDEWSLHAVGRILEITPKQKPLFIDDVSKTSDTIHQQTHYAMAESLGLNYGPSFQGLHVAYAHENIVEVTLKTPTHLQQEAYCLHPALLDVCYQSLIDFYRVEIQSGEGAALLPIRTGKMEVYPGEAISHFKARLNRRSARSVVVDFEIFDTQNNLIASLTGCRFRAAPLSHKKNERISHWNVIPWLQPHPRESLTVKFPKLLTLEESLHQALLPLNPERQQWFQEAFPLFEALILSFTFEAFQEIMASNDAILTPLTRDAYIRWLANLLIQENLLIETEEGKWILEEKSDLPSSKEIWQALFNEHPNCLAQLTLLGRIGRELPKLLQQKIDSKSFLNSLKYAPVAEGLYDEDPAYVGIQVALKEMLKQLSASQKNRRLRVLEISAGTTTLPLEILKNLPTDRLDYLLALPDETLMERHKVEYDAFTNISVTTFNYEDWKIQTPIPLTQKFDIVILRHTLHHAHHLQTALTQSKTLLANGGCLLIAERYPDWSADLLFGLEPAWWHLDENGKNPHSSLLAPSQWKGILENEGFEEILDFTEPASEGITGGSYLIMSTCTTQNIILPEPFEKHSWLFLVDDVSYEFAQRLLALLQASGQSGEIVYELPLQDVSCYHHVLHLKGWDTPVNEVSTLLSSALHTVKTLIASSETPPHLWFVTKGASLNLDTKESYPINPSQSALCGFGRVVMNEYPTLHTMLLDIACDTDSNEEICTRVENELLMPDGTNEIILTQNSRYTMMMLQEEEHTVKSTSPERFRLDFHAPGQLHNLLWLPQEARFIEPDEIEVKIHATGLNFRDVMYLMGLLPDEALENGFAGASLGLEFAGIVTHVGEAVKTISVGDRVMGFGSSCFSSHIVTRENAVAKMPEHWSYESAATIPTVFFTVYYSLCHLADLQPNESVLIHGGAGGVGIAAIQLAKHLGATVFATAGSEDKRAFVELLGADYVFDSRSFSFADDILAATNGKGVDVVLNSLAGEAIRRNLSILKPFGRFLELGKRDFFENTPIGLRPFRNNISYFGIDADQILTGRPQLATRLFHEVMELFYNGSLTPLPCRVFKTEHVVDAFRFMQQSRHIGKVVVSLSDAHPNITTHSSSPKPLALKNNVTWIVTGGISGFGLESAHWLAQCGVGHLALVSRSGLNTPNAQEIIDAFKVQGIHARIFSCDLRDANAVVKLIDEIQQNMPPLQGIIHAAAVYDDTLIHNLDASRIDNVMQPKVIGAWNLHQATLNLPLEYFILYSSVTVSIGNPGQANYVSANAALEGLAKMRRQLGLPATCISWGPIADAGYLTRNAGVHDSLAQRMGKEPMSSKHALNELSFTLPNDTILANFDWNTLSKILPSSESSRFSLLNQGLKGGHAVGDETDFRTMILDKTPDEVTQLVRQYVTNEVAQILAISAERIEPLRSLHDMGLDSLMAVELALGLEQRIGVQLPVMMLNDSPTVEKVTGIIVQKVLTPTDEDMPMQDTTHSVVQDLARQHGESVSEDDLQSIARDMQKMVENATGAIQ